MGSGREIGVNNSTPRASARSGDPQVVTGVSATEVIVQRPVLPVFQIGPDGLSSTHALSPDNSHAFNRLAEGTADTAPGPGAVKLVQQVGFSKAAELSGTIRTFPADAFQVIGLDNR